jgi:hypothetical protein
MCAIFIYAILEIYYAVYRKNHPVSYFEFNFPLDQGSKMAPTKLEINWKGKNSCSSLELLEKFVFIIIRDKN